MEISVTVIKSKIFEIRGQKVMLDVDLAEMYEVETKVFNQAVKRNPLRFPVDFMFTLTQKEFQALRSQIVTSKRGGTRYLPNAFTEQGVAMLSSILNSEKAIDVNIAIIRTFVLVKQSVPDYKDLSENLKKLERKSNKNFKEIFTALDYLITKKQEESTLKNRQRIGFKPDKM